MSPALLSAPLLEALARATVTVDPEPAHVVGTGGAIGAVCRYLVGHWVSSRLESGRLPLATFVVNVVGSFLLGLVVFAGASESTLRLVATGFCGSFTTFSSFSVETVRLYEDGDRVLAIGNAAAGLAGSLAAIGLAWGLVAAL
ncbi:fluoride efflux transporter CrcB [Natrinema thermotolerans]|uniref:Fluoride-specific ion channel FluC n=1 Tax=Natrinema thermotolerans TaxID=121872 RepID=A0AAF0T2X9_9EURY|nr:fluoride efflux transporter CrcB [Natrinema thermotolerans]QCC58595.1 fluoride efflux transporter CrcB [Natrinema thermotolerans]WMT09735.1 fluoride efflux transporter CrcB [Natrinema thermotolerans]